jgi:hypothetical protein
MEVYVVELLFMSDNPVDGNTLVGVSDTLEGAKALAEKDFKIFDDGEWQLTWEGGEGAGTVWTANLSGGGDAFYWIREWGP